MEKCFFIKLVAYTSAMIYSIIETAKANSQKYMNT